MNIDDEIEYLEARIEELVRDRQNAEYDEDWDLIDYISYDIASLESELDVLYEKRSLQP